MSYGIHTLADDLVSITLPQGYIPNAPRIPVTVYLIRGTYPALIGTGTPSSWEHLCDALQALSMTPEHIRRIVATDWSLEQLGNAPRFTRADVFVCSPDMVSPNNLVALFETHCKDLERDAKELQQRPEYAEAMNFEALQKAIDAMRPPHNLKALPTVPLRSGQMLALGTRTVRFLETPGPWDGHACLHDEEHRSLWSGRLVPHTRYGDPWVHHMSQTLLSVESIFDLNIDTVYPTFGVAMNDGSWRIRRINRFWTGMLSNFPSAMSTSTTIPEVIYRDLGYIPSNALRFLQTVTLYRAILSELMRTGVVEREGSGMWATYRALSVEPRTLLG